MDNNKEYNIKNSPFINDNLPINFFSHYAANQEYTFQQYFFLQLPFIVPAFIL